MIPFQLVPSVCDSIDMARDALEKFPTLVTALDIENKSPVLALASMSFAYTNGNQHRFWTQWICNCESHSLFSTAIKLWTKFEDRNYDVATFSGKKKNL